MVNSCGLFSLAIARMEKSVEQFSIQKRFLIAKIKRVFQKYVIKPLQAERRSVFHPNVHSKWYQVLDSYYWKDRRHDMKALCRTIQSLWTGKEYGTIQSGMSKKERKL